MKRTLFFKMSGRLIFGIGALKELPEAARRLGAKRPLIVTDPGIVKAGICERVRAMLCGAGIEPAVYDRVEPDPRIEVVGDCLAAGRAAGADLFIGVGGGSAIDIAKMAAILMANPGDVGQYIGIDKIPQAGAPTIMIPTTAGTGSEVTPIVVLSDKKEHLKKGVVSDHLYPSVALVDPELTAGLPPQVTAFTGMDALTHAIEAYTNKFAQPFVDMFALEAIERAGRSLRRAVACGDDLDARSDMSMASTLGGMCLGSVNTAAVHALAYPLGGTFDVPHGVANALLLPYVMEYNLISDLGKYADIADALGEETDGLSLREAAERSVEAVVQLSKDIGIVARLRDLDIPESAIDGMAEAAMKVTRLLNNNPRAMTVEAARAIYRKAY